MIADRIRRELSEPVEDFWRRFVESYYEKKPCVIELDNIHMDLISEKDCLMVIKNAFSHNVKNKIQSSYAKRIQLDNKIINDISIDDFCLNPDKDSFREFVDKYTLNKSFKDLKFVIHNCQSYYNPVLEKGKHFLKNIFEISGIPGALVDTDMFAGKYLTDKKGIHKDCGGVFMFPIIGKKTMIAWPFEYFINHMPSGSNRYVNAALEEIIYKDHLGNGYIMDSDVRGIIYFPSHWWHLALSDNLEPVMCFNLTVYLPMLVSNIIKPVVDKTILDLEQTSNYVYHFDNFRYPTSITNLQDIDLPTEIKAFVERLEKNLKLNYLQKISNMGFLNHRENTTSFPDNVFICGNKKSPIMNIIDHGCSMMITNGIIIKYKSSNSLNNLLELINSGHIFSRDYLEENYPEFISLVEKLCSIGAIRIV